VLKQKQIIMENTGLRIVVGCLLVACLFGALTFSGCDGGEPDPCKTQAEIVGGFTIYEYLQHSDGDTTIATDTTLTKNIVVFKADTDYVSYEWKVGDDPRVFSTKEVPLSFDEPVSHLKIQLIAKWNENSKCFPRDNGVDTVVRYLTVIDQKTNPIFGEYRGANQSNASDDFNITVMHDQFYDWINIININKGCYPIDESSGLRGFTTAMGYKTLLFNSGFYFESCNNPKGIFILHPNGHNVSVYYSTGNGSELVPETKRMKDVFKGIRLN
jgi:hypothetical protein